MLADLASVSLFPVAFTVPDGWTSTPTPLSMCPGVGVTATTPILASGATATFTLTIGTAVLRASFSKTVTVTSSASDPNPANNSATELTAVSRPSQPPALFKRSVLRLVAASQKVERQEYNTFARQLQERIRITSGPERKSLVKLKRSVLQGLEKQWKLENRTGLSVPFCFPEL